MITERLKEYMIKGFTMDDERFKGNGRISRLPMNLDLMNYEFNLVIITKEERLKYYGLR